VNDFLDTFKIAGSSILSCNGLCREPLTLIATPNPELAIPGLLLLVGDGDLDLFDYDINDEAKEQIQEFADSMANM
jgi:hypothetical protein